MAGEWIDTTLGDVLTFQRGFDLPETERNPGAYPVIASTGPVGTHLKATVKGPGVVIGRSGSLGGGQFITGDFWPLNTTLWVKDFKGNDRRFCYYLLKSLDLAHFNAGSGVPTLNRNHIHPLPLRVPRDPTEQRAIAQILGALDDKIELNRRMSETLEAMARALFKSWFVDFDPVRAMADGRDPGLRQPLSDLFPDSFVDSELGDIPTGWAATPLGDVADVVDCSHATKPGRRDTGRPLLQLANIRDDGLLDMTDAYLIADSDYIAWTRRMEASSGDCVITNVGRVGAVAQIPRGVSAALGRNMTGIRCKAIFPFPTFLIETLLSEALRDEIAHKTDTGTILDALNVRNIPHLRLVVPSTGVAERFEATVRPFRARMEANLSESRTLAAVRDALLPRLISGALRVRDAERIAVEAGV